MQQKSIIDEIKKNITLRKKFVNKFGFVFEDCLKVAKVLFNKEMDSSLLNTYFQYKYLNNGKKCNIKYFIEEINPNKNIIKISRNSQEGKYTTTIELSKNKQKMYYFENVLLKDAPFQIWGQVGLLRFKKHFRKRKKLIIKELKNE